MSLLKSQNLQIATTVDILSVTSQKINESEKYKEKIIQLNLWSSAAAIFLASRLSGPFRIQVICPDGPQTYLHTVK